MTRRSDHQAHAAPVWRPLITERMRRIEILVQLGLVVLLATGCWLVLEPFFSAILFAIVIALSTWPAYRWLLARLHYRHALASSLACVLVVALIVGPAALLTASIGDAVGWLARLFEEWSRSGFPRPPEWLARIPVVGATLNDYWLQLAAGEVRSLAERWTEPLRNFVLATGRVVGAGVLQLLLAVLALYYLYRHGRRLGTRLRWLSSRIGGEVGPDLLRTANNTVVSVMVGVLGTALAQATVATIGFAIAGVPDPLLLGAATFMLTMIPVGPPLIWGGAALWLFRDEQTGWAVFMVLYGIFLISTVDNIVKPYLISRGARLPFILTLLGVLGGLLAFGVMGLFLGPVLLALAVNLTAHWFKLTQPRPAPAASDALEDRLAPPTRK